MRVCKTPQETRRAVAAARFEQHRRMWRRPMFFWIFWW